ALGRANGRAEPWRVPFWGLRTEAWGCGGQLPVEQFASLARQYATYTRNHAGNTLYRIAAGADSGDLHWTETLMRSFDDLAADPGEPVRPFQAVSLHYYTMSGAWSDKGEATGSSTDEW